MVRASLLVLPILIVGLLGCASKGGGGSIDPIYPPCKLISEPPLEVGVDGRNHIQVGAVVQFHIVDIWTGKNYDDKITSWKLDGDYPPFGTVTSTGLYTAPNIPTTPPVSGIRIAAGGDVYSASQTFSVIPKPSAKEPPPQP